MLNKIIFSLLFGLFTASLRADSYTLADLEVLSNEGSYGEFFKHALDIRPSERQDAWKAMVAKMADAFTQSVLAQNEVSKENFKKTEGLYGWPSLKTDDVFKLRRQEIGIRYFKECLKKGNCWDDLKSFWAANNTDPEMAMKLAELVTTYPNSPLPTWNFLDVALKSPLSEFYCKKEFVITAIWGKLEMDYVRLGPNGDLLTKIDQTLHPDCLPSLNQSAHQKLFSPGKTSERELAYQVLKAQNKADKKLTDFFYTVYLLERPSQGELFNYSWNRLKELGASSNRRDEVLAQLKRMDPLPDELFSSLDLMKKKAILTHFKNNFPEYLSFYTRQCIEFYGGKGSFPAGNPTIHCQDMMSSELAPQFIDQDLIQKYQEAKKI